LPVLPNGEEGTTYKHTKKTPNNPRTPYTPHNRVNKNLKWGLWGGRAGGNILSKHQILGIGE